MLLSLTEFSSKWKIGTWISINTSLGISNFNVSFLVYVINGFLKFVLYVESKPSLYFFYWLFRSLSIEFWLRPSWAVLMTLSMIFFIGL